MKHELPPYNEYGNLIDIRDDRLLCPADRPKEVLTQGYLENDGFDVIDFSKTPEERLQIQQRYLQWIKESMPGVDPNNVAEDMSGGITEVPGCPEDPERGSYYVWCSPKKAKAGRRPVIFFINGGGTILVEPRFVPLERFARRFNALAISANYTDSLHGGYPVSINDLHASYKYIVDHADELNIDPNKILLMGMSTGAQMVLSLAFRLKRYGYKPCGAVAFSGITDDRGMHLSTKYFNDNWDGYALSRTYKLYLGDMFGSPFLGPEGLANRATVEDCKGLCPMFISTEEFDPDRDNEIEFVSKLYAAGVYTSFHVWPGRVHGGMGNEYLNEEEVLTEEGKHFVELVNRFVQDCFKNDLKREFLNQ